MSSTQVGEYLEVMGLRTFFIKKGSGPAVLLLHGQAAGGCAAVMWGANMDHLAGSGFTVYGLDEAGFGRTDNPTDFSIEMRTAHAEAFTRTMGLESYSMWGHSDGSYIAAAIALRDPRVDRLILQASGALSSGLDQRAPTGAPSAAREARAAYVPSLENARRSLMRSMVNHELIVDDLVAEMYAMSDGKNLEANRRRLEVHAPPIADRLRDLRVPTLLLWGRNDNVAVQRSLALLERIPGAELHMFDRCGHWIQRDQAARVNAVVVDFLRA